MATRDELTIAFGVKGTKAAQKKMENLAKQMNILGITTKELVKDFRKEGLEVRKTGTIMDKLNTRGKSLNKTLEVQGKVLRKTSKNTRQFKMHWLGIMFGAMVAQRRLQTIMSSSVSTFMEIAGANNEANQALAAFGAQWTFLKFTIGSALGEVLRPLIPTLITIVEKITDFVEQHPDVVVWGLVTAFGALLTLSIVASLALFTASLVLLGKEAGIASISVTALKASLWGLAAIPLLIGFAIMWQGWGDFTKAIKEGDLAAELKALLKFGLGGALAGATIGFMVGGPAGALIGAGAGFVITIGIGVIYDWAVQGPISKSVLGVNGIGEVLEAVAPEGSKWKTFFQAMNLDMLDLINLIKGPKGIGEAVGLDTKGSFPLVYSLKLAEAEWITMRDISVESIEEIITHLNNIPRTITTVHRIVTVRSSRGGDDD